MKILFLTQILPYPPDSGPKVKTWNVIRYLAQNQHQITLVSFVRSEELENVSTLEKTCSAVHVVPIQRSIIRDIGYMIRSYITGRPFLIERDDLYPIQKLVNDLMQENDFDFIHADQLTMVQFALRGASFSQSGKTKVVFDAHNAVWTIVDRMKANASWYLKPILGVETKRIKRYEGELLTKVDHVLAVTDADRYGLEEALKYSSFSGDERVAPIAVIPIAVDTQRLQPIKRKPESKTIVTLGTLHYPPNADGIRWFFNDVFPLIQKRTPEINLVIIGKNPPPDFLDFAEKNPNTVKVTGYVPDLAPLLEESALTVVPVRAGGGMRVRILEAFAYAMPVVTTTVGLEGIDAEHGKEVLVADTEIDFANFVSQLIENVPLQEKLAANARRLATTKYDWQVTLSGMKAVYE